MKGNECQYFVILPPFKEKDKLHFECVQKKKPFRKIRKIYDFKTKNRIRIGFRFIRPINVKQFHTL